MFCQAFKKKRSFISGIPFSKSAALCINLFYFISSILQQPFSYNLCLWWQWCCQYNVPPPLQPALGASISSFHIETLAASLCSRSTITYGAAALGCDVPKPLFCIQRSLSNLIDAHSLDGPEKKPTVDLERREVTVFTHRTCRHWIGWSFLWYQQLCGIIIYLLTWVSSSILSVISFKYVPHTMEWASCSSSFFFSQS